MTDTITLTILEIPGLSASANLATRRFAVRGQITVDARRGKPVWLPEIAGCAFLDPNGIVYAADRDGTPTKTSSLVEEVFGSSIGKRFGQTGYIGFRFTTEHPKILAACIEDDTTIDLPLDKALSLLKRDQRLYLARENLAYAVREAVARIGRPKRGDPADLTLRQIFGTIS